VTKYHRQHRAAMRHIAAIKTIDERDVGLSVDAVNALGAIFGELPVIEYPPCLCLPSVPWDERKLERPWPDLDTATHRAISRTCLFCGATKSIEVPR
jgi:hypothetical protein